MQMKYSMPTRIVMGKDCVCINRAEFSALGKKALVVTGARSAKANGALDDVVKALTENGQTYAVFDKVPANPGVDCVYEGASVAKMNAVDFVIAIGGGSPMDAAKAIAVLSCQDIPEEALFSGKYGVEVLPMVFIPTTAGTGSEVTPYAILTNDRAETKTGIATPLIFPRLALLDARYMSSLSKRTTINTAIDAFSHSVEGIISVRASAITDILAMEGIRLVSECFAALAEDTLTFEQREKLLLASTLGGMVIANTGTTALHAMGYSLTYFRDIDHGRANGLLLVEFLKFVQKTRKDLVQKILVSMRMNSIIGVQIILEKLLGEKEKLSREEMEKFAGKAILSKNVANCVVIPNEDDLLGVFLSVFSREGGKEEMARDRHSVAEFIKLEEYIPAKHFRTIPVRLRAVSAGPTEIYVELELSASFASKLKFPVPWDGKVYGFVHDNEKLKSIFVGDMAKDYQNRHIYVNDWGESFLVTFENGAKDADVTFFVKPEEMNYLFENCNILYDELI